MSILTLTLSALALCEWYQPPVLFQVWTFLLVIGTGYLIWQIRLLKLEKDSSQHLPDWVLLTCQIGTWVFIALCFMTVMTPETRHDPYDYHVMVPTLYLQAGKIVEIPWHVFSYMPKNTEIVYGLALSVGNDSHAKLIHFIFGCFGLMVLAEWTQITLKRTGAWLSIFFTVTLPLFGFIATSAYIDLALGFWEILSLYCLAKLWDEKNEIKPQWLYCMAFWFAGMALGTKYTAYAVFFPAFFLCGLYSIRKVPKYRIITLMSALLITPLPALCWWSVNAVWTLNPLYPLLPQIFGYKTPAAAEAYRFLRDHAPQMETYQFENLLPFLWTRINSLMLDGNALFLIGIGAVFMYPLLKKNETDFKPVPFQAGLMVFVLVSTLIFFVATDNHDGRFFYGTLALLSIPATQLILLLHQKALERSPSGWVLVPVILIFVFFNGLSYRFAQLNDQRETIFPLMTDEQRDDWLQHHFPGYSIIAWANQNLPQDAKVMGMGYPLQREFVAKNKYGYVRGWEEEDRNLPPEEIFETLRNAGFTHVLLPNEFFTLPEDYKSEDVRVIFQNRGKMLYQLNL